MKLKRWIPVFSFLLISILFFSTSAYAVMGMNYPGTRARSMGNAFTAVADDASAVWHNPAGLAIGDKGTQIDIILEGSETMPMAYAGEPDKEFKPYAAIKGKFDNLALALSYFTPYTYQDVMLNSRTGLEQLDIVSLGIAYALPWRLNIGGTAEYVFLNNDEDVDLDNDDDFSGSLGVHWTPFYSEQMRLGLTLGGAYRFESEMDNEVYFAEKPESWNVGAAVTKAFGPHHLTLSGQYEETDFSGAWESGIGEDAENLSFEMTSLGVEWVFSFAKENLLRALALRAGVYNEEAINDDWEMDGYTFGAGLRLGESWGLEYAFERRDYEVEEDTLHSVALTYTYTKSKE